MNETYTKYKEVRIPDEMLSKINPEEMGQEPQTMGQAGVMDWLTEQSKEGWEVVWEAFLFPHFVFRRTCLTEK